MEHGNLVAMMFASHTDIHVWSDDELRFVRQVGDRLQVALARLRAERQQQIINHELSHRLKNSLAMVQAIATQTLRDASDRDAVTALSQRIGALARAHDILMQQDWQKGAMAEVTGKVLSTFADAEHFRITGPKVLLGPETTLSYSLLLHELGTNAVKGALSIPEGSIEISWTIEGEGEAAVLDMLWREVGGPSVTAPTKKGFGSRLIQMGLAGKGTVDVSYPSTGLVVRVQTSMSQLHHK